MFKYVAQQLSSKLANCIHPAMQVTTFQILKKTGIFIVLYIMIFSVLESYMSFGLLLLFSKNRSRLMRSPCCLFVYVCLWICMCISLNNLWMPEPVFLKTFVCISWHLSSSHRRTSYIVTINNTNIVASQTLEVIILILLEFLIRQPWNLVHRSVWDQLSGIHYKSIPSAIPIS
jgi:hypothetical protein